MVEETFRARLRRLRYARGLTQRALCDDVEGVTYAYISRIEKGTRTPSVRVIRKLARVLRVDPHYLETGKRDPDRERARALLEEARFWRARARFLERRLEAFEGRETEDMVSIAEVLHNEALIAGQLTVEEAIANVDGS